VPRSAFHEGPRRPPVFDRLFREYGLPRAIRTDNGVPFATTGIHGLSQLNVWWLRLGIQHQRILPAHPEQNGAHERMHKTLKAAACRPPRSCLATQQRAFTAFRHLYNDERPHEALGDRPPARCIVPPLGRTPARCPRSSIPAISSSSASPTRARFD
jgi:putative transposase